MTRETIVLQLTSRVAQQGTTRRSQAVSGALPPCLRYAHNPNQKGISGDAAQIRSNCVRWQENDQQGGGHIFKLLLEDSLRQAAVSALPPVPFSIEVRGSAADAPLAH